MLDATPSTLLLEATGPEEKIDSLLTMLRGFGIRELVRTGKVAMALGGTSGAKGQGRVERITDGSFAVAG